MLEARDLTFGYSHAAPVLRDATLQVGSGERVALMAPSGAGKTTLCRMLAGYERPWSGEVLVDGAPLPKQGVCPVQLIGQHPELSLDPRMTIEASLREAEPDRGTATRGRGDDLLECLGILPSWLSRYPRELSGGELQRCCIARALLAQPRYLIADEMTAMLDAVTQARVWRRLLRAQQDRGFGLLLTTHSPSLAERIATRIVELPLP